MAQTDRAGAGREERLRATIDGANINLGGIQLATPTTILRSNWSHTKRSDRPDADGLALEARQYIAQTRSAVVGGISHYKNVGSIRPVTTYGSVVANSAKHEWHQTLPSRLIAMAGYRNYVENEKLRAADAPRVRLGSDYYYTSLRWQQAAHMWTDDASELYVLGNYYKANEPRRGYLVGLGGSGSFRGRAFEQGATYALLRVVFLCPNHLFLIQKLENQMFWS